MSYGADWDGDNYAARLEKEAGEWVEAACYVVENYAKQLVSVSGTGGKPGKKRVYGSSPSAPGSPPHKQRGSLRLRIAHVVNRRTLTGKVGTPYKYGLFLELGTSRMAARPWLRRSIWDNKTVLKAMLARIRI